MVWTPSDPSELGSAVSSLKPAHLCEIYLHAWDEAYHFGGKCIRGERPFGAEDVAVVFEKHVHVGSGLLDVVQVAASFEGFVMAVKIRAKRGMLIRDVRCMRSLKCEERADDAAVSGSGW